MLPNFRKISALWILVQTACTYNPWQNNHFYQGDIILPRKHSKNVLVQDLYYWPNGILPYKIGKEFNNHQKNVILRGLTYLANKTCIKPIPAKPYHKANILFKRVPGHGCASHLGTMNRNNQEVYLDDMVGCVHYGVVVHEVLHALGFWHQQSSHDRDDYIKIFWDNVIPGLEKNFEKANQSYSPTTSFELEYDYGSIMHYDSKAFSRNGRDTSRPKHKLPEGVVMGQKYELSQTDIKKVKIAYNCS